MLLRSARCRARPGAVVRSTLRPDGIGAEIGALADNTAALLALASQWSRSDKSDYRVFKRLVGMKQAISVYPAEYPLGVLAGQDMLTTF